MDRQDCELRPGHIHNRRIGLALGGFALAIASPVACQQPALASGTATAVSTAPLDSPATVRQLLGVTTTMRDGTILVSDIYLPGTPGMHPVVLFRTPYLRTDEVGEEANIVRMARRFAAQGIGFVHQDTRGRGESGGANIFMRGEGADGYDTIEWIARQPWSDGKVAMLGGSYRGSVQWLAAREHPPHLTCLFSQAPGEDWFQTVPYNGGAFQMEWSLSYLNLISGKLNQNLAAAMTDWAAVYRHRPLIDQDLLLGRILPLRRAFLAHPTIDSYWKSISLQPADYRSITLPAMHVTGWFDSELPGAMTVWHAMQRYSPARAQQHLIIGPWTHAETRSGGSSRLGDIDRGEASVMDIETLSLKWFQSCFAGTTDQFPAPRAQVFMTGANTWLSLDAYPAITATVQPFYLGSSGDARGKDGANGMLTQQVPGAQPPDRYEFDPHNVAPPLKPATFVNAPSSRSDELVYTSAPMAAPLAVLGSVKLTLFVETSARDTDFVAILHDVDGQGRALPVNFKPAIMRARYREGFDRQVMMVPGQTTQLALSFYDIGHVFEKGHRVRITVSSFAPGINPNQNTGNDVATDTDWKTATQTILHDKAHPSRLDLPVIAWP